MESDLELVKRFVILKYDNRDGYKRYLLISRYYHKELDCYVLKKRGIKDYEAFKRKYPQYELQQVINLEELDKKQPYIAFYRKVPFYERNDSIDLRWQ